MELEYTYADYAADKAIELIGIDSPSGYTERAARWVQESFEMLGFMTACCLRHTWIHWAAW